MSIFAGNNLIKPTYMKLKVGDPAPMINSKDQHGKAVNLADLKGNKVILYFYPKDDTPGCTAEACNLRDNYDDLLDKGFKIVGVSADSAESHVKFSDKYRLPFPLIPDTDKKIIKDYGVWGTKKFMGKVYDGIIRTTFIISEQGKIEQIITDVKTKDHSDQIFKMMGL
jgi:thioredoxin-dependent peroxiredoxin